MSRPRDTERKDRWYFRKDHPYYKYGYIFERNGSAYVFIKPSQYRKRLRKNLEIPFSAKNKALALKYLEDMIVEHHKPVNKLQEGMHTVYDLFEAYAKVKFPNYTHVLKGRYVKSFNYLFNEKDSSENFSISDLPTITVHVEERINTFKKQFGNAYIRKILQIGSAVFNYHVKRGVIGYNPIYRELFPEEDTAKKEAYTLEQIKTFITHFNHNNKQELALLIEFIAITGCRIEEALKTRWNDIDENIIVIHGKGGKDREFPINVFQDMRILLDKIKKLNLVTPDNQLFSWIATDKPRKHIREAAPKLGINVTGFHAIRRFRENQLVNDYKLSPRIVAALLGHTERVQKKHYLRELDGLLIEKLIKEEGIKIENSAT